MKGRLDPTKTNKGAWKILFRHLKDYKQSITLLAVLGVISALANGTVPYVVGRFLDALLDLSATLSFGGVVVAAWLGILILWVFVQLLANIVDWIIDREGTSLRIIAQLGYQARAFSYLLFLPLSFHKNEKIGELTDLISRTSWQITQIAQSTLVRLTPPILSVIVGLIVTALINPVFTLVIIIGIIIYTFILVKLVGSTTNFLDEGYRSWSDAHGDALQAVTNIQSVKSSVAEKHEEKLIQSNFLDRTAKLRKRVEFIWSGVNFYQRLIILATQATIFFMSVYFISNGELTIGELVALNGYAALLFGPFVMLGHNWQIIQSGLVNIRQAEEKIFDVTKENYHPENAYVPGKIEGRVEFKNASFSYDSQPVLKNIDFIVKTGERVAFVGKSGVGKSTAIDLISAYYFPTEGRVLVDGHDTREFDLTALRAGIAIVPQEPVLFNDTIMMNIKYGKLGATEEDVIEAAKKAHAHDFIDKLPEKYNQIVGERGVKLSVGQKQRIAIARAILRNPAILILDEPTSALDAETEQLIAASFDELMRGRTTFIIAHRLSTVRKADRIFVFEEGKIVEEGKHDDLIKLRDGVYKRLHDYQTGQHK